MERMEAIGLLHNSTMQLREQRIKYEEAAKQIQDMAYGEPVQHSPSMSIARKTWLSRFLSGLVAILGDLLMIGDVKS